MDIGMAARPPGRKHRSYPPLALALALALVALAGCSEERVNTVSVMADSNCKGVPQGLTEVELADIARFRGSELVNSTVTTSAELPLLVALSRGPQPSRGFELHLAHQARVVSPNTLALDVYWTEPDKTRLQPLVTTTPCLVVSVPEGPWERIEATDQNGETLGELTRSR